MVTPERKAAYEKYISSPEWCELKIDLITIRGMKCEKCNRSTKHPGWLHVHHLTYERLFNEQLQDLMLLCAKCHMKEHGLKVKKEKKVPKKQFIKVVRGWNTLQEKPTKFKKLEALLKKIELRQKQGYYTSFSSYIQAKRAATKSLKKAKKAA